MSSPLQQLFDQRQLWRARSGAGQTGDCLPSGWPALDAILPGGGWSPGALSELLCAEPLPALRLLQPLCVHLARAGRLQIWLGLPHRPYAPGWQRSGLALERCLLVQAEGAERIWAAEQALRQTEGALVLAVLPRLDTQDCRRLQLAAQAGRSLGLLIRPADSTQGIGTPAVRLRLQAEPGGVRVECLKRRGAPAVAAFFLAMGTPPPGWPPRPLTPEPDAAAQHRLHLLAQGRAALHLADQLQGDWSAPVATDAPAPWPPASDLSVASRPPELLHPEHLPPEHRTADSPPAELRPADSLSGAPARLRSEPH